MAASKWTSVWVMAGIRRPQPGRLVRASATGVSRLEAQPVALVRSPKTMLGSRSMGKRKGNQRDTAFSLFEDAEFVERFYARRQTFNRTFRRRVEREAKARGIRNVQRRRG